MATVMRIAPGEQPSWTPRPQTYKPQHAVFNSSAHEVSYAEALLKSHRQPSDALVTETNIESFVNPPPALVDIVSQRARVLRLRMTEQALGMEPARPPMSHLPKDQLTCFAA